MKKIKAKVKTKYGVYSVVLEPEKDMGGYTVEALNIQGAVSWGKTLAEAKKMIVDAIEGVIEVKAIVNAEKDGSVSIVRRSKSKIFA